MTNYTSTVSEPAILRQAVLNTSSSIELFREAVSNSVDANAQAISLKLTSQGGDMWEVVIEDNGNGMEEAHMKAFFNAGETVKDFQMPGGAPLAIGEKGLGSKTTFVANDIHVESRRYLSPADVLVGHMTDPLAALAGGNMPGFTIEKNPAGYTPSLVSSGTRITLHGVHISTFNGKRTGDPNEIADRLLHYLRSMCATGTVKNRHAHQAHIVSNVVNVGVIPLVTLEVVNALGTAVRGPDSGSYQVPLANVSPTGGPVSHGVAENSKLFCDVSDFSRSKTLSVQGTTLTVHYDGTAIIAGEMVRADQLLKHELKQGWTQKSQMGVHLCKDFIPLRNDATLSRELLDGEFFYEYKVFLNCQTFQLNADRNVVTNTDSDEIAWIWEDFKAHVWPTIAAKAAPYKKMKDDEEAAIEAVRKAQASAALKSAYANSPSVTVTKQGALLAFVKLPRKEADVSHLLAMMVQSGAWSAELSPIVRFGQYIDASTDVLVEDSNGSALLAEIELSLPNLFRHKHPMDSYDLVVTWDLGNMTNGSTAHAPWGAAGATVAVSLVSGPGANEWHLKWGVNNKKLIVLSDIL